MKCIPEEQFLEVLEDFSTRNQVRSVLCMPSPSPLDLMHTPDKALDTICDSGKEMLWQISVPISTKVYLFPVAAVIKETSRWLETTGTYALTVLTVQVQNSRCWQGPASPKCSSGESIPRLCLLPLPPLPHGLCSLPLSSHPFLLCASVSRLPLAHSYQDTYHWV